MQTISKDKNLKKNTTSIIIVKLEDLKANKKSFEFRTNQREGFLK